MSEKARARAAARVERLANEEAFPPPEDEPLGHCLIPGCPKTFKDHHWGRVEATNKGWFFKRDETGQWCPAHLPEWVEEWRARRAR